VKDAQEAINQIVGSKVLTPDGQFGMNTTRWIKQFQKDRGLKADGIIGVGTWQHLISARLGR
jgi:peptidoglycan hydrolase-like protein with peptidoglycan-binding domain